MRMLTLGHHDHLGRDRLYSDTTAERKLWQRVIIQALHDSSATESGKQYLSVSKSRSAVWARKEWRRKRGLIQARAFEYINSRRFQADCELIGLDWRRLRSAAAAGRVGSLLLPVGNSELMLEADKKIKPLKTRPQFNSDEYPMLSIFCEGWVNR